METKHTQPTFPWYKERLLTKYLKDPSKKPSLDTSCWRVLNTGLDDDLRDDFPSSASELRPDLERGASPVIFRGPSSRSSNRGPGKRLSKEQACFSKRSVQQQIRREHVAAVEEELKQHPLALYPHYQQAMPPELFDQVLSVVDPEMCIKRASAAPTPAAEHVEREDEEHCTETNMEEVKEVDRGEEGTSATKINPEVQKSVKNPYIRLQVNDSGAKEASVEPLSCPFQDEDIKRVTKLFSEWFTSLGGETDNATDPTIPSLFFSGFGESPSLTFPLQVTKADSLPDEPHNIVPASCRPHTNSIFFKDFGQRKKKAVTRKPRYGAWYLDPKTWKKSDADELLREPNAFPEELEFPNQTSEKDEELKQLHITQVFTQYLISKGVKVPQFLGNLFSEEEREALVRGGAGASGSASTRKGTAVSY